MKIKEGTFSSFLTLNNLVLHAHTVGKKWYIDFYQKVQLDDGYTFPLFGLGDSIKEAIEDLSIKVLGKVINVSENNSDESKLVVRVIKVPDKWEDEDITF